MEVNIAAKTLLMALAIAAAGCSASAALPPTPDGTQCRISSHGYPWGTYGDKICTDTSGNTTTTRMVSSGLYDSGDVPAMQPSTQPSATVQHVPAQSTSFVPPVTNPNTVVNPNVPTNQPPPFE